MAQMLCEYEDCDHGEKEFFRACEKLDDSFVVYHNRYLDGQEFDFCILIPNYGLVVVEVKDWLKEKYLGPKNGELLHMTDDGPKRENPYKQARGYKFALRNPLKNKIGRVPLIIPVVCFTKWDDAFLQEKHIATYCGGERYVFGLDDLQSPERLGRRLCESFKDVQLEKGVLFTEQLLIQVRDYFDPGYAEEVLDAMRKKEQEQTSELEQEGNNSSVEQMMIPFYSAVAVVPEDENWKQTINDLLRMYAQGTKITAVLANDQMQQYVCEALREVYQGKAIGWKPDKKEDLRLADDCPEILCAPSLRRYNWSSCVMKIDSSLQGKKLLVLDGNGREEPEIKELIQLMDQEGMINKDQYYVEHEDPHKHILVRAGAGTGKTAVMIDRISYLIYKHQMLAADLRERIIMITFTDAAAENMNKRLKRRFQNQYLLTGNGEYLAMVGQVNQMQISTIHSYALKLIKELCVFSGYSSELAIESGQYNRSRYLEDTLEQYLNAMDRKDVEKLDIARYELRNKLKGFVTSLENKSVDLSRIQKDVFGSCADNPQLHQLLMDVISQSEKQYADDLKEKGKIFLGRLMPELVRAVDSGKKRLKEGKTEQDRYLFVDEFQDTDDYQIRVLLDIAKSVPYHMFCVGDRKQCIYRFRGAEEQAFDKLGYKDNPNWIEHSLVHNYRTDDELLKAYEPYFINWGKRNDLAFTVEEDSLDDPIHSNGGMVEPDDYMHRITVKDAESRLEALFAEINRRYDMILSQPEQHKGEDRTIAVLVRENWQARDILQYEKTLVDLPYRIITETGGDLFQSEPALDMLTLCQAIKYDDVAHLYHFAESGLMGLKVNKAVLYNQKKTNGFNGKKVQLDYLHKLIDQKLQSCSTVNYASLEQVRKNLRILPVMQVLHQIYLQLEPWKNYGESSDEYRLNVDVLFELFLHSGAGEGTSIDKMTSYLSNCIFSKKEAERRFVEKEKDDDKPVVRCLTVHKAKGLEYGYVILPFTDLPINKMKQTGMDVIIKNNNQIGYNFRYGDKKTMRNEYFIESEELAEKVREETRVLYVAMTRARKGFSWIELENKKGINWQYQLRQEEGQV